MPRDCGTAFMQEMLHATWIVNSRVILFGYLFLGKKKKITLPCPKNNSERVISSQHEILFPNVLHLHSPLHFSWCEKAAGGAPNRAGCSLAW